MKLNNPIRFLRPSVQILYPKSSEREYYRLLRAMVRMLNKLSLENIETLKDVLRYDSTDSERISGKVLEYHSDVTDSSNTVSFINTST